jgi:hypothetical protein
MDQQKDKDLTSPINVLTNYATQKDVLFNMLDFDTRYIEKYHFDTLKGDDPYGKMKPTESMILIAIKGGEMAMLGTKLRGDIRLEKALHEKIAESMWTDEEVDVAIKLAIQPYKKIVETMKIVFGILFVEIAIIILLFLLRSVL